MNTYLISAVHEPDCMCGETHDEFQPAVRVEAESPEEAVIMCEDRIGIDIYSEMRVERIEILSVDEFRYRVELEQKVKLGVAPE